MKKQWRKRFAGLVMVIMICAVCFSAVSSVAWAGETWEDGSLTEVISDSQEMEEYLPADADTLLSQYMGLGQAATDVETIDALYASNYNGKKLSKLTLEVYNGLKDLVVRLAAGQENSTVLIFTVDPAYFNGKQWTASDLGVSSLYGDASKTTINREASEKAIDQILTESVYDPSLAVKSLIRDCPYEMFWFGNKYTMTKTYTPSINPRTDVMTITSITLKIELQVAPDYWDAGNPYFTNVAKIQSVRTAMDNAANIVATSMSMDDYSKMDYFRQQICNMVTYNTTANTATYPGGYGNPWQLIYVFDGNPNTNVVCEGYAKAFQYLCDESGLTARIPVYSVAGAFHADSDAAEGHLWNVVHMNGANYLVDLTNCDGDIQNTGLFLAKPVSGSIDGGYVYQVGAMKYTYLYYEDSKKIYSNSELEMLSGWQTIMGQKYYIRDDGTKQVGWLFLGKVWYYFNESGVMQTGWVYDNNEWYYMNADGIMQTGWLNDGGNWYYLKPNGAMATGWVLDGNTWYYMNPNGTRMTGWLLFANNWYYLNQDGTMATGWVWDKNWYYMYNSGIMAVGWIWDGYGWYYMNGAGIMQTGWVFDGNNWYFMNSSGTMMTGWLFDGGNWYYLNQNGTMAIGWVLDGGKWYYMNGAGIMQTGWIWDGTGNYYLDEYGVWVG